MTTLTIQTVDPATRTWEGPKGTIEFIQGQFTDGTGWSLGAKPENAAKRIEELTNLIGVEGNFDIEAKGEFRGKPQWKLKGWPGKPVFGGGGGNKAPRDETGMAIGAAGHDAATLVAAGLIAGKFETWVEAEANYYRLTGRIFQSNQSLRATTPPGAAAETGAGVSPTPVPTTSPADEGRGEKTASTKDQGAAGDWGAGAETPARGGGTCSHQVNSYRKPNGDPLPNGFIRCEACGFTRKGAA